jgi:hypothetical protein
LVAFATITLAKGDKKKPGCKNVARLFCLLDKAERIANAIKL